MADENIEALRIRYEAINRLVLILGLAAVIASFWVPLQAVVPIVDALAGKSTTIALTATISVGVTVVLGGSAAALIIKDIKKRKEMQRLRERNSALEKEVAGLQNRVGELQRENEKLKKSEGKSR